MARHVAQRRSSAPWLWRAAVLLVLAGVYLYISSHLLIQHAAEPDAEAEDAEIAALRQEIQQYKAAEELERKLSLKDTEDNRRQTASRLAAAGAEEPLVTFVIPTSGRDTLARTLASVRAQGRKNWLVFLVLVEDQKDEECNLFSKNRPVTIGSEPPSFFKGKISEEIVSDKRIKYAVIPFSGYTFYNQAGGEYQAALWLLHLCSLDSS